MISLDDVLLAQQGNDDCIEKIIKYYYPLIYSYNRYLFLQGGDKDDLIQEGIIGLLKAIKYYDVLKQVSFNHFANLCIRRKIASSIKRYSSTRNFSLNYLIDYNYLIDDENLFISKITPEIKLLEKEFNRNLKDILIVNLSDFEKLIYNYLLEGYGYIEIANLLNLNKKNIDNSIQRIRNKVKFILKNKNLNFVLKIKN